MGSLDSDSSNSDSKRGSLAAVRVVIADDHQIWRAGVRADLGENFEVVGEAGDGTEAVEVIKATNP